MTHCELVDWLFSLYDSVCLNWLNNGNHLTYNLGKSPSFVTFMITCSSVVKAWADAFCSSPDLTGVVSVYEHLRRKGLEFPEPDGYPLVNTSNKVLLMYGSVLKYKCTCLGKPAGADYFYLSSFTPFQMSMNFLFPF